MAMTKKNFVALADAIIDSDSQFQHSVSRFNTGHLAVLARFCESQNPRFNRERWLGYIAGENGPNGGKL